MVLKLRNWNYTENINIYVNGFDSLFLPLKTNYKMSDTNTAKSMEATKPSCLQRLSGAIIGGMENIFYRLGRTIGNCPVPTMIICMVVTLACGVGMIKFYQESAQENLWVPIGSEALVHKAWVEERFKSKYRFEAALIEHSNVLTPQVLQGMLVLDKAVKEINGTVKGVDYNWETVCVRLGPSCWSNSLLELWSFDENVINSLTTEDIILKINTVTQSPVYFSDYDVEKVLGEITRNSSGSITGARATTMVYALQDNTTQLDDGSTEDPVRESWESSYLTIMGKGNSNISQVYYFAGRSFSDEGGGAILGDSIFLTVGYFIVIVFVAIVLGKFNALEQRVYVTLGGIVCIGFSIVISFGLSSAFGLSYGPVHSLLPFLLLGIGVDDVFVIIQSWSNLSEKEKLHTNPEKIGIMMKHAGVAITVTSLTDVVAFAIGATTVLPSLRSFCLFAAIGILAVFFLQATFFVACVTIDQRRVADDRNACCCCYKHKNYVPNACSQKPIVEGFFKNYYAPFMMKLPVKIITVLVGAGLLAMGIYGFIKLEQDFDQAWFLPTDSYAYKYVQKNEAYFPGDGVSTNVYIGEEDYFAETEKLEKLYNDVSSNEYTYEGTTKFWYTSYRQWLNTSSNPAVTSQINATTKYPLDRASFGSLLNMFLFTDSTGQTFIKDIKITSSAPYNVTSSRLTLKHRNLPDAKTEVAAMDTLRGIAKDSGLVDCIAYTRQYSSWESNKVIQEELYRNLGLALACVFIMILILIANLWTCLLVVICVTMVLVDVAGTMYFWGLTVDTVTSIQLILAIGLAVDYSAHIGHTFMTVRGDRNDRVKQTLGDIGPAVFYGGFSTFLAFLLLALSNSYVFTVFFKVFLLVVSYGLFHGLVFLPVVLSWLGPGPYIINNGEVDSIEKDVEKDGQIPPMEPVPDYDLPPKEPMPDYNSPPEPLPDYDSPPPSYKSSSRVATPANQSDHNRQTSANQRQTSGQLSNRRQPESPTRVLSVVSLSKQNTNSQLPNVSA